MIAVDLGVKLTTRVVECDGAERTFFFVDDGPALATETDLGAWLELRRTSYPLRKIIAWFAERGTLGDVKSIWSKPGRSHKGVSIYLLSREQLLVLLACAAIQAPETAKQTVLRCYDLAEDTSRPPPPACSSHIAQDASSAQLPLLGGLSDPPGSAPGVETIRFAGGVLSALRAQGQGWLVLKPACELLGVDARGQQQRLERTPWATACMTHAVGADGKNREMYCLRSDRVAMWLATIDSSRISDPDARHRLEIWQCHAAEALDSWWRGASEPGDSAPSFDLRQFIRSTVEDVVQQRLSERTSTPPPPPSEPVEPARWLSPQQAADFTGVDVRRIYRWLKDGELGYTRLGPRDFRIRIDDLRQFLASKSRPLN